MFVQAARVELVPAVEGGLLWVVHQDELLAEAEPAGVGACSEGLATGQDPPLDGHPLREGVGVVRLLLLERPYIAAELGVPPLVLVQSHFFKFFKFFRFLSESESESESERTQHVLYF